MNSLLTDNSHQLNRNKMRWLDSWKINSIHSNTIHCLYKQHNNFLRYLWRIYTLFLKIKRSVLTKWLTVQHSKGITHISSNTDQSLSEVSHSSSNPRPPLKTNYSTNLTLILINTSFNRITTSSRIRKKRLITMEDIWWD